MPAGIAYFNGSFRPDAEVALAIDDLGIVSGVILTDRVRSYGGEPFLVREHCERFLASAERLGIGVTESSTLDDYVCEVFRRNGCGPNADLAVVFVATPGRPNARPTLCLHAVPQPRPEWAFGYENGWAVSTSEIRAMSGETLPRDVKHRSRLHWYLAAQGLPAAEGPIEPLLLDDSGFVTETAYGNILAVESGGLTAVTRGAALPGVMEAEVIGIATSLGLNVGFKDMTPAELKSADEVILTSTGYTIAAVTTIDGAPIGDARPGPTWRQLADAFSDRVGFDFVSASSNSSVFTSD